MGGAETARNNAPRNTPDDATDNSFLSGLSGNHTPFLTGVIEPGLSSDPTIRGPGAYGWEEAAALARQENGSDATNQALGGSLVQAPGLAPGVFTLPDPDAAPPAAAWDPNNTPVPAVDPPRPLRSEAQWTAVLRSAQELRQWPLETFSAMSLSEIARFQHSHLAALPHDKLLALRKIVEAHEEASRKGIVMDPVDRRAYDSLRASGHYGLLMQAEENSPDYGANQLAEQSAEWYRNFTAASLECVRSSRIGAIGRKIQYISPVVLSTITAEQISGMNQANISALAPDQLLVLSDRQLQAFTPKQCAFFTDLQLADPRVARILLPNLSPHQMMMLPKGTVDALTDQDLMMLNGSQLAALQEHSRIEQAAALHGMVDGYMPDVAAISDGPDKKPELDVWRREKQPAFERLETEWRALNTEIKGYFDAYSSRAGKNLQLLSDYPGNLGNGRNVQEELLALLEKRTALQQRMTAMLKEAQSFGAVIEVTDTNVPWNAVTPARAGEYADFRHTRTGNYDPSRSILYTPSTPPAEAAEPAQPGAIQPAQTAAPQPAVQEPSQPAVVPPTQPAPVQPQPTPAVQPQPVQPTPPAPQPGPQPGSGQQSVTPDPVPAGAYVDAPVASSRPNGRLTNFIEAFKLLEQLEVQVFGAQPEPEEAAAAVGFEAAKYQHTALGQRGLEEEQGRAEQQALQYARVIEDSPRLRLIKPSRVNRDDETQLA